ncbi:MAG: sel1 repeat family protein [Muribaculaceae bacterium]|nr:sel1 repeat family protein [Muribaculaceae bacterium]
MKLLSPKLLVLALFALTACVDANSATTAHPKSATVSSELTGQAKKYYKQAKKGDAEAQYQLGNCYLNGYDVDKDDKQAVYWFTKAAKQGHPQAQCDLAVCYANGEGVDVDEQKMVYWYQKAADQDDPVALRGLYLCYAMGTGVEVDEDKALDYLTRAAETGLILAQHELGVYYYNEGMPEEAFPWFVKAAEQGFARSQNELGLLYQDGEGVEQDIEKAAYWFEKAAMQGHPGGMNNIAAIYFNEGKYENAIPWLEMATKTEYVEALYNLAICYEKGYGVEKDIEKAKSLLQIAADKGDIYSAIYLKKLNEKK